MGHSPENDLVECHVDKKQVTVMVTDLCAGRGEFWQHMRKLMASSGITLMLPAGPPDPNDLEAVARYREGLRYRNGPRAIDTDIDLVVALHKPPSEPAMLSYQNIKRRK